MTNKFELVLFPDEIVFMLNTQSHFLSIRNSGIELPHTAFPQKGVDYNRTDVSRCVKITGVDEL